MQNNYNSEVFARTKLAKDINKAYNAIVKQQPELEGKPQLVIELLSSMRIFTEYKQRDSDNILNFKDFKSNINDNKSEDLSHSKTAEFTIGQKYRMIRKENEQQCFQLIWELLSFGDRKVTKDLVISSLYSLLRMNDLESIEDLEKSLRIEGLSHNNLLQVKSLMDLFKMLLKDVNNSRYISQFAKQFESPRQSSEEMRVKECTFTPSINYKSKKLMSRRNSARISNAKRNQSNEKHEELYANYKERKNNILKLKKQFYVEQKQNCPFIPKISAVNNCKEDRNKLVRVM